MQKGLVTVVIPNYNYAKYLGEAIESVLGQTYADIEIVVVDDGSTDASRTLIEGFGDRIKAIFQQNQGVCAARNNGAAAGRGEFLAFLDADDVWLPEKIASQVDAFTRDAGVGLVHVGVADIDADGREIRKRLDGLDGDVVDELLLLERPVILGGGSGLMVRRDAFDAVGGFDRQMSTSADWDLCCRIGRRYGVAFVEEVLMKYRIHGSNMHGNVRAMEHDVLIAYERAFAGDSDLFARIGPKAYANFYRMLAGSYLQAGQYFDFLRTGSRSVYHRIGSWFRTGPASVK